MYEIEKIFIEYLQDIHDIHFTKWHYAKSSKYIEIRLRSKLGVASPSPCWPDSVIVFLWDWFFWQGSLLQTDLTIPQHTSFRLKSLEVAFRLSYAPISLGRRLVVRIDHQKQVEFAKKDWPILDGFGFSILYRLTGSGKTTAAYSWLQELSLEKIVISVEDPPESLNLSWAQFDRKIFTSDEKVHHLVLRQNPDVLFWGELRDAKTWSLVENWITTGQHVLTTMHANSLMQCYERLLLFGADREFLNNYLSNLFFCSRDSDVDPDLIDDVSTFSSDFDSCDHDSLGANLDHALSLKHKKNKFSIRNQTLENGSLK